MHVNTDAWSEIRMGHITFWVRDRSKIPGGLNRGRGLAIEDHLAGTKCEVELTEAGAKSLGLVIYPYRQTATLWWFAQMEVAIMQSECRIADNIADKPVSGNRLVLVDWGRWFDSSHGLQFRDLTKQSHRGILVLQS
mgnify:CR=1 FL=1